MFPLFNEIIRNWSFQVREWAKSGELILATINSLKLERVPDALLDFNEKLIDGDWSAIPKLELLNHSDMRGALGAWSKSTQTIYINSDWLKPSSAQSVSEVLTEELGLYLDSE